MERSSVIHSDPEILGGAPVFVGTRVPLQALIDYIEGGHTLEEFLDDFPSVPRELAIAAATADAWSKVAILNAPGIITRSSCNIAAVKNVTVTLDRKTAARARVKAAERNMSLSRYIGEVLRKELRASDEYEAAYRAWRAEKPFPLKGPPQPYPKREDLYDRPVLRRR